MELSLFDKEINFISELKSTTGKPLEEWFGLIAKSMETGFLGIRKWLVDNQKLATSPATTITLLYLEDVERKAPKVYFHTEGRGGDFFYENPDGNFSSWWEFGGGDALAILNVPSAEHWEAQTGIPLAKRAAVLEFIGKETVRQQTTGGRGTFEVQENFIVIRSR